MFKIKNTGRAIAISAVIVCICFAMLLGTTFAWFTDTEYTHVNVVKSGTLEVGLYSGTTNIEGGTLNFLDVNGTPLSDTYDLWEPGATYQTEEFTVKNEGKLAFIFKIEDLFANAVFNENDQNKPNLNGLIPGTNENAISFTLLVLENGSFVDSGLIVNNLPTTDTSKYPMLASGDAMTFKIVAKMSENAGNDYQDCSISNMAITINATQAPYETDSVNNTYDTTAPYAETTVVPPVTSAP